MDVLSDVLGCLQLRGTVYFKAQFNAPWGIEIDRCPVAAFHVVSSGNCWVRRPGHDPFELHEGDIVIFPRGAAHSLSDRPESQIRPAGEVIDSETGPFGGSGPGCTSLICGHFEYDMGSQHPLVVSLPEMLHSRAQSGTQLQWVQTAAQIAVLESRKAGKASGSTALVERLAETLLIQVICDYARGAGQGFLAALAHPGIAKALEAIHESPSATWTVESLGEVASMSRSSFAERFRSLVGASPMQYATQWRMVVARNLLLTQNFTNEAIALAVGYQDAFAFAKAFKRTFDESPSNLRRRLKVPDMA